ncbi:putative transglutaminase-like cysteine proteinase [Sphingomonas sp. UYAg733]
MSRYLRLVLSIFAIVGLAGQSTAMAMAPVMASQAHMQAAMAGMDCKDMVTTPSSDGSLCKKLTSQCIAAMGCLTASALKPAILAMDVHQRVRSAPAPAEVTRLIGRSYGPEPDPPSFLI